MRFITTSSPRRLACRALANISFAASTDQVPYRPLVRSTGHNFRLRNQHLTHTACAGPLYIHAGDRSRQDHRHWRKSASQLPPKLQCHRRCSPSHGPFARPQLANRRSLSTTTMSTQPQLTSSIAIIGAGDVGSTIAYSLILNPIAGDILLVDPATDFCQAQARDLSDSTNFGSTTTRVRTATHADAGQCDIIVMTAGAAQAQGESRTDLIGKNVHILKNAIEDCKPFRNDAILLVVANPVDVLTHFAQQFSGLPRNQVFGSGTFLDTARLRGILARQSGVAAGSIDGYVLGEHGESQLVAWSHASIGGIPLDEVVSESQIDKAKIADETKNTAAAIIDAKGVTAFGIGGVAASLCKSILFDERNIRPVSLWQEYLGVCLSMPAVIGREGVVRSIQINLDEQEKKELEASASGLRDVIQEADKNL